MKRANLTFTCKLWCGVLVALLNTMGADAATDERVILAQEADSPEGSSTTASYASKAVIDASSDKTTATLKLSRLLASPNGQNLWNVAITGKSPFDSDKDNVKDIGTLSGLTAGSSAKAELGFLNWPKTSPSDEAVMDALCSKYIEAVLPDYFWARPTPAGKSKDHNLALAGKSCAELLTIEGISSVIDQINKEAEEAAKKNNQPAPRKRTLVSGANGLLKEGAKRFEKATQGIGGTANALSLALTVNRQKFSYASEAAPTEVANDTKTGHGASLTYSRIGDAYVLGVGYSYESSYAGGDEVQICSPIGTTGSSKCGEAALQSPEKKSDRLLFIEYRAAVPGLTYLAVSPRLEYSTHTSDLSIKMPVFLATNSSRPLDGGLTLAWDKKEHFGVSVFVGKAFTFFD